MAVGINQEPKMKAKWTWLYQIVKGDTPDMLLSSCHNKHLHDACASLRGEDPKQYVSLL
jgi:hypothetical protein